MRKLCCAVLALAASLFVVEGQRKDFSYTFYGFVRGDLFYNSRDNIAPVDGNFYLYPKPVVPDVEGKDLNANPNGSFYTFTTRLGMDAKGPNVGNARTAAKIETDFGGYGPSTTMLRIRQAYVTLDWERSRLLIGHTWHPLFGAVAPDILNLSTGAPFQPFNRSPMLHFRHKAGIATLSAATVWQLQYTSAGPASAAVDASMVKGEDFIKNSGIPEVFLGADFTVGRWLAGAGVHMISLKPRTAAMGSDGLHKVNERMTTFSGEAHVQYKGNGINFAAKSLLASAIDHSALLGGYGISGREDNGRQEYTPFRHSTSWVNLTVGKEWQGGLFVGFSKNLGTDKPLIASTTDNSKPITYGAGLDIDYVYMVCPMFCYNLPHWKIGLEYSLTCAAYGDIDLTHGTVSGSSPVTNHRLLALMMYFF